MISHKKKCIFIHIPKVAGTSIIEFLKCSEHNYNNNINIPSFPQGCSKFSPPPPHFRVIDYVKYGYVSKEQFNVYFKFSFVRNPWDRIVSEYKYRNHPMEYSFKEFLFRHFPKPSWNDKYCHIIPQYDFLYDENGNNLVDFVGKFENLQKDFNKVCRFLGIPDKKLPHRNQSQSLFNLRYNQGLGELFTRIRGKLNRRQKQNTFAHYTQYYDSETEEYVAELYKNDINVFQYKFGH